MKYLRKIGLVLIFVVYSSLVVKSQSKYVSIADFDKSLKNSDLSSIEKEFDLLKILLLDHSKQESFFDRDPELKGFFYEYKESIELNRRTVGFITEKKEIMSVFNNPDRIFDSVFSESDTSGMNYRIDQPIYIHQNRAIIEILSPTASDLYYVSIYEGVVQINWLGGTIE